MTREMKVLITAIALTTFLLGAFVGGIATHVGMTTKCVVAKGGKGVRGGGDGGDGIFCGKGLVIGSGGGGSGAGSESGRDSL